MWPLEKGAGRRCSNPPFCAPPEALGLVPVHPFWKERQLVTSEVLELSHHRFPPHSWATFLLHTRPPSPKSPQPGLHVSTRFYPPSKLIPQREKEGAFSISGKGKRSGGGVALLHPLRKRPNCGLREVLLQAGGKRLGARHGGLKLFQRDQGRQAGHKCPHPRSSLEEAPRMFPGSYRHPAREEAP